ncbi:bifunctional aspartate kinase/homoserine dehydrogenase II [Parashewanella spongiae]|uniref:Bifunctional aspartokinase/homoserine dehydrogenase n=1 Tax=Parashewanella spongiae TaxID=342950 RepID=A0A3A6TL82_9GAMM|nr:bifunctional aspartate kinase/homoserine dehydrogenase II [Parashewanella spongiae]MCL1078461.1 bifunctional aspartate kinase/homoserine dehydrogenase II [Parashewanella spongiae]RJY14604.1 bifunctional aspartate kinase/homoserine dehydrogenase II [Parashewanella spongiae]
MAVRHVHKFGGSSLADADCYRRVAHILLTHGHSDDIVIVSASGKTTNQLYRIIQLISEQQLWKPALAVLIARQQALIDQLFEGEMAKELKENLDTDHNQIVNLLTFETCTSSEICKGKVTEYQQNQCLAFGELWSSRLLARLLNSAEVEAKSVDARDILIADEGVMTHVRKSESALNLHGLIQSNPNTRLVITGFICSDTAGKTLLLGRNGSDYSASLIASLADIERVTIWTDVEGVFNADPNKISDAKLLSSLSLTEADRLAKLGTPVLHSRTLQPLFNANVSLAVRSSFASHTDFTLINPQSDSSREPVVTSVDSVVLFTLKTSTDTQHILHRLNEQDLIPLAWWRKSKDQLLLAFTLDTKLNVEEVLASLSVESATSFSVDLNYGLVALVSHDVDLYRRRFARLLNREAIPLFQDSVSLVTLVPQYQVKRLIQKVHRRCTGPKQRIAVVLFGAGNIGRVWLEVFEKSVVSLSNEFEAQIDLVGIVNSTQALLSATAIALSQWKSQFKSNATQWDYKSLFSHLDGLEYQDIIVLDVTASASLTLKYDEFFNCGIHLVSANKLAGSGPMTFYQSLKQQLSNRRLFWRYNASCGAGLPIQYSLNDLHNSGDSIEAVGGIFSGTLCWLFEHYDGQSSFSELVLKAKQQGITEPDPRDDLSGRDMQRKLLIIAREIGLELELEDIQLDSLVPEQLADIPLDEFLNRCSELDSSIEQQWQAAKAEQKVIRYVASLEGISGDLTAKVGIEWVDINHPYASLTPGDNVFVIKSKFYQDNPLIIRGPGAGREVTAAAIQSDLTQICRDLLLN